MGLPVLAPEGSVLVTADGWGNPAMGRITSGFGYRLHPVFDFVGVHTGTDVASPCGTSVHSAAAGTVAFVGIGFQGRTGNQVVITHGDGVVTRYGHLLSGSVRVRVGDTVELGEQIAAMGGDGAIDPNGAGLSTGCHLHFEVNQDDGLTAVDAAKFLAERGVALGVDEPPVPPTAGPEPVFVDFDRERIEALIGVQGRLATVRFYG